MRTFKGEASKFHPTTAACGCCASVGLSSVMPAIPSSSRIWVAEWCRLCFGSEGQSYRHLMWNWEYFSVGIECFISLTCTCWAQYTCWGWSHYEGQTERRGKNNRFFAPIEGWSRWHVVFIPKTPPSHQLFTFTTVSCNNYSLSHSEIVNEHFSLHCL